MDACSRKPGGALLRAADAEQCNGFAELHARPLDSLAELLSWQQPIDCCAQASVSLDAQYQSRRSLQQLHKLRTLVCHDMAGGYLDDRLTQGSNRSDAYRFFNWLNIDVYVYFSHHFITIPPPCWINSAHRHGVPVLGTFITEWQSGAELCKSMFSSAESAIAAVQKMVEISSFYRFDGWLINIENEVKATHVATVLLFLKELRTRMHQTNPASLVIWYDSITVSGQLSWQNELNSENSAYFDESDGIFLNYTWKEDHLRRSAALCSITDRRRDVFVGIDVFGRGMIGDGGFNTNQAVELARKHRLSIALFAPGWVYEKHGCRDFMANECRFWKLLSPSLMPNVFPGLPLFTSFCQGFGQKFYVNGKVATDRPWTNVSLQHLQPLCRAVASQSSGSSTRETVRIAELWSGDAYNGGGCLRLSGAAKLTADDDGKRDVLQWQIMDLSVSPEDDVYVVCTYQNKCIGAVESCLCLQLEAADVTGASSEESKGRIVICLMADDDPSSWLRQLHPSAEIVVAREICEADVPSVLKVDKMSELGQQWLQRVYRIEATLLGQHIVTGLLFAALVPDGSHSDFLIGQIQVVTASDAAGMQYGQPVKNLSAQTSSLALSGGSPLMKIELTWNHHSSPGHQVFCYHVWQILDDTSTNVAGSEQDEEGAGWMLIGSTPAQQYTMQLDVTSRMLTKFVDVAVQAVYASGVYQKRGSAARQRIMLL